MYRVKTRVILRDRAQDGARPISDLFGVPPGLIVALLARSGLME
jgi:hypothetical protein